MLVVPIIIFYYKASPKSKLCGLVLKLWYCFQQWLYHIHTKLALPMHKSNVYTELCQRTIGCVVLWLKDKHSYITESRRKTFGHIPIKRKQV